MKKNLFLGMLAAVGMLFATSCSTDEPEAPSGNEAQVTFALDIEGEANTRAISDGTGATKLIYAVYKGSSSTTLLKMPGSDENSQFSQEFNPQGDQVQLTLIKGQIYTVVFWAQNPACTAYTTTDLKNVTVNYEGANNDDTRDAFYKAESFTVEGDATINVTLKRPFAQINVGVTSEDWNTAVATGVNITKSKVTIKDVPTGINLCNGKIVGNATDVSYKLAAIPTETLKVDSNGDGTPEEYHYLSMSYILASANQSQLNDMEFSFKPDPGQYIVLDGLNNVPVQRNWRTNIIGSFLANKITFNIVVDPAYTGDYNYNYPDGYKQIAEGVMLDETGKTYYLTSKKGLQWLQEQTAGGTLFENYTVKLTSDITFGTSEKWTPIPNFQGTFDGCNYTIKNLKVTATGEDSAGLFANAVGGTIKNLNLKSVTIEGNFMTGAIVGCGRCTEIENCHVDGGSITSTPHLKDGKYDDGNNVGGIVGYLPAEPNASVKNCSVSNLKIKAYRDVGGIVGKAQFNAAVISGNTVSNVTVTADQLCEYGEVRDACAGEVVGRNIENAQVSGNTAENVTVTVLAADENGKVEIGENIPLSDIANITNENVKEVVLTGDVEGKAAVKYGKNSKIGVNLPAGITLDGGENSLNVTGLSTSGVYVIATKGGTIKNFSAIEGGERGIVTYAPTEDVIIENVVIDQPGYAINTLESATKEGLKFIVRNSTINGWSSWAGGFASAEFTECNFGENSTKYWQKYNYSQMFDRFMRPYITTTFTKCNLIKGFYISLEVLPEGQKLTFDQCKVDGTVLTADNYSDLVEFYISGEQPNEGDVAYWVNKFVAFK